ncbi:flagellar assembly protein FliW [Campylobacter sputorum]|uniref:flagellar assembly protein FliW n=1 Tax=Campylobacter sputorum TaxID=206 RepID=UPI00053BECA6|nr:flagellar assembly protein FliW [Campylobacter sputorum]
MIFDIKSPILGFEQIKKAKIVQIDDFFARLESQDDKTTFTLINPYGFRDYAFEIPDYYIKLMDIKDNSELRVYVIVALNSPLEESTMNFVAPIVCNMTNNTISQVILDTVGYPQYKQADRIANYINKDN